MYSYQDRMRAVELYMKLGRRITATIRQLGYPTKNALRSWYREYQRHNDLTAGYVRLDLPPYFRTRHHTKIDDSALRLELARRAILQRAMWVFLVVMLERDRQVTNSGRGVRLRHEGNVVTLHRLDEALSHAIALGTAYRRRERLEPNAAGKCAGLVGNVSRAVVA